MRKRRRQLRRLGLVGLAGTIGLAMAGGAVPRQPDIARQAAQVQPISARALVPRLPAVTFTRDGRSEFFGSLIATGMMLQRMRRWRWI